MQPPENPFYERLSRGVREANLVFSDQAIRAYITYIDVLAPETILQAPQALHRDIRRADPRRARQRPRSSSCFGRSPPRYRVITLASDLPLDAPHHYYVGLSNLQAGRLAGELMGRLLRSKWRQRPARRRLNEFSGHRERETGFLSVLGEDFPKTVVVARFESRDRSGIVGGAMARILRRHPNLSGIYNIAHGTEEIARHIEPLRESRHLVFICHDLTTATRPLLISRQIDAVIDQDPIFEARRAIEIVLQHYGRLDGQPADGTMPPRVIFRENAGNEAG